MRFFSKKKALIPGLLFLLVAMAVFFLIERNNYLLNKTVRFVSFRLTQYERFSFIRSSEIKIEFKKNDYEIFFFNNHKDIWQTFARHQYGHGIVPSIEEFEILLSKGKITSFKIGNIQQKIKSYLIVYFYHPRRPEKKKGIIFYGNGNWRVFI